jgi:hypothetical protein
MATTAAVDHDISLLVGEIRRLGQEQSDGSVTTTFGALFADDKVQNTLESLAGTLKAAKRKKIIKVSTTALSTPSLLDVLARALQPS